MATKAFTYSNSRGLAGLCAAAALLLSGCPPTIDDKRCAVEAINKDFRRDYEAILQKDGTRVFRVSRAEAYDAVRVSMARLGMTVETQDPVLGFVSVYAPAPRPLDDKDWAEAATADVTRAREIIGPCVGLYAHFFNFEPAGLEGVITATVFEVPAGTAISFTARMREVAPPRSGFPRREYLPPTAVKTALDKIWREVEREFKATVRR
jgi:hypothetical protein